MQSVHRAVLSSANPARCNRRLNQQRKVLALIVLCSLGTPAGRADHLPSWAEGNSKQTILQFVERVTRAKADGQPAVPGEERIAVFENDGTLWSEQPLYLPFLFCIDRLRQLAVTQPQWRSQEPYASALRGDIPALLKQGPGALASLLVASSSGLSTEAYSDAVRQWLRTARHPITGSQLTRLVYQPMLELLRYLQANGFRTFIVTGGDVAFVRVWAERVYGVPPEQIIGTRLALAYRQEAGRPQLWRLPQIESLVDGPGKPIAIEQVIGRRPLAAFGNSDGDLEMLHWTTAGPGPRLALLIHHTDGRREWAYDRLSIIGRLDTALDQARHGGWTVVDMARDWRVVYPTRPTPLPESPTPARSR